MYLFIVVLYIFFVLSYTFLCLAHQCFFTENRNLLSIEISPYFRTAATNGFRSSYYGPYASSNSNNYMLADRSFPATAADDDQYRYTFLTITFDLFRLKSYLRSWV